MNTRTPWQGMLAIARFNWPFYVAALVILAASSGGLLLFSSSHAKMLSGIALAGSAYFLFGSLAVSHAIYDRSDLYRWEWLDRALRGMRMSRAIFCHAGFDETSRELRVRFADAEWLVLDHFEAAKMTEASIRRARRMFPPTAGTLAAPSARWPVASQSADLITGILAIHELRSADERANWFSEARRCLRHGGRIVLVEHVRDLANFLAFGPGFLHFHSRTSWRRAWESAGLHLLEEFCVTPWLRVFVLTVS